jgi:hypothetical protein
MSTERCHVRNCVRVLGHAGCHTACPSSATLDWDQSRVPVTTEQIEGAASLLMLDFPTPSWADLND